MQPPLADDPESAPVTLAARAKLNLSLAIGPRQDDGYHLLESLMVPLDLHDDVTVALSAGRAGIELHVSGPTAAGTPPDATNLAWRAADLLARQVARPADVRIGLHKRIPVGGGLAGGSADAAATLVGLNRLWALNWPIGRLATLAAQLGSDVPFCVHGQPSWVRGRGEIVQPLADPLPPLWALLILPPLAVSTRAVYERLDAMRQNSQSIIITRKHHLAGLECFNDLERPALDVCHPLGQLFQTLERTIGVPRLMVAGSGSTLCAVFDNSNAARQWEDRIRALRIAELAVTAVLAGPSDGTCGVKQGDSHGRQRSENQAGGQAQ